MSKVVQWKGDSYLCSVCGTEFNNRDLKCPTCKLRADMVLGIAAAGIDVDKEDYIDSDKKKNTKKAKK
jgi:formate dehydrogenase maturation protein FdhE